MTWSIQHVDLRAGQSPAVPMRSPVLVAWWWGALPLGSSRFLPGELPLGRDQLLALAGRFAAEQLASRSPALGGTPRANGDGQPLIAPTLEAVRGFTDFDALEELAQPSAAPADDLTIVVCTRDRPEALRSCLRSLLSQRQPAGEIVVVDNSATGSARDVATATATAATGVRYVHEPRPGLSVARNAGVALGTRRLIAFTDDDVEVHPNWTAELARAFDEAPHADAVTGLVLPAVLDTAAQRFFEFELGGFVGHHQPMRFDDGFFQETLRFAPPVWRIGAGANMAFRRAVFDRVGGFDERLGAGAAGCSEDSELWYRILVAGGECRYEPRAVVYHHHRADWPGLRRQMHAYMRGHVAALLLQHAQHGHRGNLRRALGQMPRHFAAVGRQAIRRQKLRRAHILAAEVSGWLAGLAYALRPGWRAGKRQR